MITTRTVSFDELSPAIRKEIEEARKVSSSEETKKLSEEEQNKTASYGRLL